VFWHIELSQHLLVEILQDYEIELPEMREGCMMKGRSSQTSVKGCSQQEWFGSQTEEWRRLQRVQRG
jgi:hypothetical protein